MCWYIEIYGHVSKYLLPTYLAFFSLFQSTEAAVKHKPDSIPFDTCALGQANTDQSEACLGSNMFLNATAASKSKKFIDICSSALAAPIRHCHFSPAKILLSFTVA